MKTKVAFIGLGVMGFPMAGYLAGSGYDVTVFNRTASKAEKWRDTYRGKVANTPAEAADNAEFVFACVGNDDDVRAISYGGDGVLASLSKDAVFIDHTTTSAKLARELAEKAARLNAHFVDAPVSGGQAGAEKGILTIMCGGEQGVYKRAKPLLECYARHTQLLGPNGSGQICKMVNQICVAGVIQGLSEALHFAEQAGMDSHEVINVISRGAAQSWQMENRHETMINGEFDFGFAVDWMRKDLDICLEEAKKVNAKLPVTRQVNEYYKEIQAMNGGRWDTSALIHRLRTRVD